MTNEHDNFVDKHRYCLSPHPGLPGNCSMRRLERLHLVLYHLHGSGQPLDPGCARSNTLTFSLQASRREKALRRFKLWTIS